ncbi:MAG TPA: type 4a pilus biogenesis protein PilO [Rugosibacter sp.]|nr:type 4a pilus biogenesis protein PilO [Rugosibacter sp.]MDD3380876.1 type 4a pilus biogenesis protein PilO [Rugosibacter sp.]HPB90479.1 type 4a pilus biogenesis protein PilO [Rugosibacter sp.]HQN47564.1 type 4a pilus biogenesis protein PilO [Rugosibacter sp.]HQQ34926.1 type 4a pilus biogenesis protein PilO [Rugosibacter sp.]
MSEKPKKPLLDLHQLVEDFKTIDPQDPGLWPLAPRVVILLCGFLLLIAAAWWFGWSNQLKELEEQKVQELSLRDDWLSKKNQSVNLEEYRRQLAEIDRSFGALLKQLPNRSEMGDLLVDINKAAQGRGLAVELFKPGSEAVKDFYAEVPITLNLAGGYHDIGAFTGDIAKLPRIVTLNDISLSSGAKDGLLALKTTVKTFRYLDDEELSAKKKAQKGAQK